MASPLAMALLQAQAGAGGAPPNRASVAPTNYVQANSDYNTAMEQQYAAKLQQQQSMWGGLAGLGSAGILVAPKLLGSGSAAGTGGAELLGNASGGTAASPLAGLTAADYGPGASLLDTYGLGSGAVDAGSVAATDAGATAAADAGATAATDLGATAAADGGSSILATLASLLAFA